MNHPPSSLLPPSASADDRLDALLARRPVAARVDFAAAVRARLAAEDAPADLATTTATDALDERIDAWLTARPFRPAADFTARTLAAVRADPLAPRRRPAPLLNFPSLPRWVPALSAFAALLTLAVLAPRLADREDSANPTSAASVAVAGLSDEAWRVEWELLALGDGLNGVEALLDDDTLLILSLLTEE